LIKLILQVQNLALIKPKLELMNNKEELKGPPGKLRPRENEKAEN
jgi:hypothetical protein